MSKRKLLAIVLSLVMVLSLVPQVAFAAAGDKPEHSKGVEANGDGTYKIELTVTGDADTTVQTAANVNVLIIYDVSSSMTSNNVTGTNRSRADYAEDVVHDFIEGLRGYQDSSDPSNIQAALVTFGPTARGRQTWTSDLTGGANGINRFFDDGVDGTITNSGTNSHNYNNNNGTNWEAALQQAQTYLNSADSDPTFVILVTDGACTASGNGNNAINPAGNHPWTDFQPFYNAARDEALAIQSREKTTLFGIYAYGTEADLLDDLIYYSNEGSDRAGMDGDTDDTDNYYNANDTSALNAAIESIFQTIVQALGVSQVAINDGTTSDVAVGSETVDLVKVIEEYQYWLSIPLDSNNQFKRIDTVSGEEITYTVSSDGKTVTWGDNSVTVNGEIKNGQLKYEWTEANDLYQKAPPTAYLDGSSVKWEFPESFGALLDGVTYSVTFDVYPTQETLDYIADVANGKDIPEEVAAYIHEDGSFDTNTEATISWVDTRDGSSGEDEFAPPGSVKADTVEMLTVSKEWKNLLEEEWDKPASIKLNVTRDEVEVYEVELLDSNNWKDDVYISIGIMKTEGLSEPEILAAGHDYTFTEPDDLSYRWEIDVPVVRPMMIDGEVTMLIKVDEAHPAGSAQTYTIDGSEYYVGTAEDAALTATNERRSSLILTKVVEAADGVTVPDDAVFPFTLTVNNALAPEEAPADDEDHESDYWVWISVRDKDNNRINEGVEGATPEDGSNGWYYAPSGTPVTIQAKAGYSIRINNLPTGSTYTIAEGDMPPGFIFEDADIAITKGEGTKDEFEGGHTSTGEIENPNAIYTVTFTNKYEIVDVTAKKVWDDNDDSNELRPDSLTLTLNGAPDGYTVPDPTVAKSEDGNTWTYTWAGLPKYDNEEEIEYTVTEETLPDGYTCEVTTVDAGGTITNVLPLGDLTITKTIEGLPEGEVPADLVFTVTGPEGSDYEEEVAFSDFEDGDDGSYTYTIEGLMLGEYTVTESDADYPNYTLETAETDMTKKATVEQDEEAEVSFTNTYTVDKGDLTITKTIEGLPEGEVPADLVFTVTGPEGSDYEEEFDFADFDQDDEGGYYLTIEDLVAGKYTVTESGTDYPDYTLAEDTETKVEATVPKDKTATAAFTNTYTRTTKEIEVTKVWEDDDDAYGLRPDKVSFIITGSDGETYEAELTGEGNTWTAKVEVYATENGKDITYEVEEDMETVPEGYANEVDNDKLTITNSFEPCIGDPPVQKILEGDKPVKDATFKFKFAPVKYEGEGKVDKLPMPDEKSFEAQEMFVEITGEGTEEFGEFELTVPGKYTYTITEEKGEEEGYEYDETVHTIVYNVTVDKDTNALKCEKSVDGVVIDGDETDEANVSKFSFTNTYTKPTVEVAVVKDWDDGDNAQETRPTVVTIALKANGKDTGKTVKLNEDNKWMDVFAELDKYDENGKEIEYTVEEQNVPTNYTATVSGDAKNGFQVTNKLEAPDTGDHSDIALWSGTMAVSVLGLVLLALIKRRKPAKRSR